MFWYKAKNMHLLQKHFNSKSCDSVLKYPFNISTKEKERKEKKCIPLKYKRCFFQSKRVTDVFVIAGSSCFFLKIE